MTIEMALMENMKMNLIEPVKESEFFTSCDLDEQPNREITLTIDKVVFGVVKGKVYRVCYWTDKAVKPMLLNENKANSIYRLYGTCFHKALKNKTVTIGSEKIEFLGETYDILRIKGR